MFILVNKSTYVQIYKHLSIAPENTVKFVSFSDNTGYKGKVSKRENGDLVDEDGNRLYMMEVFFHQYKDPYPDHKICTSSFFLNGDENTGALEKLSPLPYTIVKDEESNGHELIGANLMKKLINNVNCGESKLSAQSIRFRCKNHDLIVSRPEDNDIYLIVYNVKNSPYFYMENLIKGSIMACDLLFTTAKIYETIQNTKRKQSRKYIIDEILHNDSNPLFNRVELSHLSGKLDMGNIDNSVFIEIQNLLHCLKEKSNGILDLRMLRIGY